LFQAKRFAEAATAYEKGLEIEPSNESLLNGLQQAESAMLTPPSTSSNEDKDKENPLSAMFGPDMWGKLTADPVTRQHLADPSFVTKMQNIQKNPNLFGSYASDPKVSQALGVLFGLGASAFSGGGMSGGKKRDFDAPMRDEDDDDEEHDEEKNAGGAAEAKRAPPSSSTTSSKAPVKTLSEAEKVKEQGNAAFKEKKFSEAISFYERAFALDPKSMIYLNNIAACHFEQKDYDKTIEISFKAIEVGREHMGSYKDVAKAWTRIGNAKYAQKKWSEAIENYEKAQVEEYTDKNKEAIKKAQAQFKKENETAYLDVEKSEEEKAAGNALFAQGKWIDAIAHYTEALKRNPQNYKVLSNRAACYSKLMDWQRGLEDCDACIKADPNFVKAYIRKGKIQHFLKQYHKALETFERGLALEPSSSELIEAKRLTVQMINQGESDPEQQKARAQEAMKDPEIQSILRDPTINKVLQDLQENPSAGQAAMKDKDIRAKIEKLIAAGILSTR